MKTKGQIKDRIKEIKKHIHILKPYKNDLACVVSISAAKKQIKLLKWVLHEK